MNTEAYKKWRKANKDKVAGYMRTWRAKHPEAALANGRKWAEGNRQKTRDAAKAWYHANKDEVNARKREQRKNNLEKVRAKDRSRIRPNKNKPEYKHAYYEKNKRKIDERIRLYNLSHPEVRRTINSRRRARLLNGGRHTTEQWLQKLETIGMTCVYCHKELTFETLTKDHVIPLSKGGTDDIENVVPACLRCNQTKSSKLLKGEASLSPEAKG